MDLITDLPTSGGFDSILVVVDHGLTKGVILAPCNKTVDSAGIAKLFLKYIYKCFGLHDKVISDHGPQFISKFSRELAKLLDYQIAASTAYHPQTDGQTERLNQELETYLRIYCGSNPEEWVEHLPTAEFVHNHRKHNSHNTSPFFLMMGYEPRALPHVLPNSTVPAVEERVQKL
jgi:transposase InsO family protein